MDENLAEGERVYDAETPTYTLVEILDKPAFDVVAKEEKTDRGHVIYEEKTVADLNSDYPADDTVVRVRREDTGRELLWPISRVETSIIEAVRQ